MIGDVIEFPIAIASEVTTNGLDARVPGFLLIERGDIDRHVSLIARMASLNRVVIYDDVNASDIPRESYGNMQAFLDAAEIGVSFDTFMQKFTVSGMPQYHFLTDEARADIRMAMLATGLKVSKEILRDYLESVGRENKSNALLDYVMDLEWDGTPRLATALIRHFGADDNEYVREVTERWFIGVVRRLIDPGVKFDNVLLLLGDEGLLKSKFFQLMAYGLFFTDCLKIGSDPKITIEQTRGKWIAEMAECVGMNKKEDEEIKAFISRQVDEARGAYGHVAAEVPRQFGLAATSNKPHPLRGSTGNRRLWPVMCLTQMDSDKLMAERDQLWAEAVHYAQEGKKVKPHWLTGNLVAKAVEVQNAFTTLPPLQGRLEELLEDYKDQACFVPTIELMAAIGFGGDNIGRVNQAHADAIEGAMRRLGFVRRADKDRRRVGRKDGSAGKLIAGWESAKGWDSKVLRFDGQGFVVIDARDWTDLHRDLG